ncbi:Ankyrin-2 [Drechslerella dactyloides]|uniref:Ankyrin-2 n=1 Tax=Drechslerella dactyloides TaxID=74499 RepID=A0AAD6NK49_DREDA|nr:Ankyrin-2 [Drechslerella dactyloides]
MFSRKRDKGQSRGENVLPSIPVPPARSVAAPRSPENVRRGPPPSSAVVGENSADVSSALRDFETLSVDTKHVSHENVDAGDFYTFHHPRSDDTSTSDINSLPPDYEDKGRSGASLDQQNPNRTAQGYGQAYTQCNFCLSTPCVMIGGTQEGQRLKDTLAKMKAARSRAHAMSIGMKYMGPYIDAFDNNWKLSSTKTRDALKSNLAYPNGKLLAEVSQGRSALDIFCGLGKTELVAIMLHEGSAVDREAGSERTAPLGESSAWLGNEDIIRLLLNAGANPNFATPLGFTALHFAAGSGNIKAVKLLVQAGANLDPMMSVYNGFHSVPVFYPVRETQMTALNQVIDFLIESGASTNLRDKNKWTPLQYVYACGAASLGKKLINLGVPRDSMEALRKSLTLTASRNNGYPNWAERLKEAI